MITGKTTVILKRGLIATVVVGVLGLGWWIDQNWTEATTFASHHPVIRVVDRLQTLIAGILAIFVALIALLPVYRQLQQNRVQLAIASREVLLDRVEKTERRRKFVLAQLRSITNDFSEAIYRNDPEGEPQIHAEWAFGAEFLVGDVIEKLTRQQVSRADTQLIDDRREVVIQYAKALKNCLEDIHRPESTHLDDPDYELTDAQVRDAEVELEAAGDAARKSLNTRISAVETSGTDLDKAFDASLTQIRDRIRQINELALKADA